MEKIDPDIRSLDLECISYKACRDERWPLDKVDRIEREYRAFLQILRDATDLRSVAPTLDIDRYWHHHILDTEKYHNDCQVLFGRYIHHYPYSGIFGEEDAQTQSGRVQDTIRLINAYLTD